MASFLVRLFGHKVTHKVVRKHARPGGLLDAKYGFALFKDRNVPLTSKFLALSIGVVLTGILLLVEAPLELILGIFLPFVGEAADLLIDGAELVLFPMLIGCLVLPRLVRQPAYVRQSVARRTYRGEIIDMPPPMVD